MESVKEKDYKSFCSNERTYLNFLLLVFKSQREKELKKINCKIREQMISLITETYFISNEQSKPFFKFLREKLIEFSDLQEFEEKIEKVLTLYNCKQN